MGCPCHIVHNAAGKASDKFAEVSYISNFYDTPTILGYLVQCRGIDGG